MLKIKNTKVKNFLIGFENAIYKIPMSILKKRNAVAKKNNMQVVFVLESVSPRAIKIMRALKREGYELIAIIRRTNTTLLSKEVSLAADKVYFCISPNKGVELCLKFKPLCYHVFCCQRYDIAEKIIKEKIGRIVFDNCDGFAGFVHDYDKTEENRKISLQEKYCLENANGILCRSFETQHQKYYLGYKFKGKRLLFFDYYDGDNTHLVNKSDVSTNNLRFIYAGGVYSDELIKTYAYACDMEFAKIVQHAGGEYTMYVNNYDEKTHKSLIALSKQLECFNFRKPIQFRCLKQECMNYDYGIFLTSHKRLNLDEIEYDDGTYLTSKYKYAAANKLFDYVAAGIPFIATMPELMIRVFKHYGMVHMASLETVGSDLPKLKEYLPKYHENIRKNFHKLTMDYNIQRLINFYNIL